MLLLLVWVGGFFGSILSQGQCCGVFVVWVQSGPGCEQQQHQHEAQT
jgi:hypothetical protein